MQGPIVAGVTEPPRAVRRHISNPAIGSTEVRHALEHEFGICDCRTIGVASCGAEYSARPERRLDRAVTGIERLDRVRWLAINHQQRCPIRGNIHCDDIGKAGDQHTACRRVSGTVYIQFDNSIDSYSSGRISQPQITTRWTCRYVTGLCPGRKSMDGCSSSLVRDKKFVRCIEGSKYVATRTLN